MRLREASPADAAALLAIYTPYVENTAISFEIVPPTVEAFQRRIEEHLPDWPYLVAEEEDGRLLGYAYASRFKERAAYAHCAESSIYISPKARRRGIGRRLEEALEAALRERGITNLYASIAYPREESPYLTDDSVRFHGAMGFEKCAHLHRCGRKFGMEFDMVYMEKLL